MPLAPLRMADSLDEFFAKKDKSKKGKKKMTSDDIAKELEEGGKKPDKTKRDKDKTGSSAGTLSSNILSEQHDEEWKEFEDEKEKDYSGLRIQTLNIKDKEEELREQQMQENGEDSRKDASNAWKVVQSSTPEEPEEEEEEEPEEVVPVEAPKPQSGGGGAYVPPHRRGQTQASDRLQPMSIKKSKLVDKTPQIGDTTEFPSLGAPVEAADTKGFQPVRHGSRETSQTTAPPVLLDNKFNILSGRNKDGQDMAN